MGNKIKKAVQFLLSSLLVWVISIPMNYFIGAKLSFVYFKDGLQEIDRVGIGFDYLILLTLFYILFFFSHFFYFRKYDFILYTSIGFWVLTIVLVYYANQ